MRLEFIFPVNQLRPIVEHALSSPDYTKEHYGTKIGRCLYLVKDEGVYLMSNGLPFLENPKAGQRSRKTGRTASKVAVAYAEGRNPLVDDFDVWWIGGDDFSDPLPVEDFTKIIEQPRVTHLKLIVTARRIEIRAMKTKSNRAPRQKRGQAGSKEDRNA